MNEKKIKLSIKQLRNNDNNYKHLIQKHESYPREMLNSTKSTVLVYYGIPFPDMSNRLVNSCSGPNCQAVLLSSFALCPGPTDLARL